VGQPEWSHEFPIQEATLGSERPFHRARR
jgi:hypothetical protein